MRRVLPESLWLDEDLPHLGSKPDMGYMSTYEYDGKEWVKRRPDAETLLGDAPSCWSSTATAEEWRDVLLSCLGERMSCSESPDDSSTHEVCELHKKIDAEVTASFSDGINTGFYVNSYTTKHCPTMDGRAGRDAARLGPTFPDAGGGAAQPCK